MTEPKQPSVTEIAEKVLEADDRNLARKVAAGKVLSRYERQRLEMIQGQRRPVDPPRANRAIEVVKSKNTKPRRARKNADTGHGGDHERKLLLQQRAFELRARDWTYKEIGAELGVHECTAWGYVEAHWAVEAEKLTEKADRLRNIENRRLLRLMRHHEPIANGERPADHESMCRSAAVVLKCHERLCRIHGVDAAIKVDSVGKVALATPEEVAEAVRKASPLLAGIDIEAAKAKLIGGRVVK